VSKNFASLILFAMALGILVGYACHEAFPDPKTAAEIAGYMSLVTDLFLRLIKMIIAPLVLSTLIVGITHMGSGAALGRIGAKTMGWFVWASLVSLLLGMLLVNLLQPGVDLSLPLPDAGSSSSLKTAKLTLKEFVTHVVPRSIIEAMATNEILQIVVFAIFAGVAIASLGERSRLVEQVVEQIAHMMLEITSYVMKAAPLAVFAAIAATVTTSGLGILVTFGKFMGEFYISLFGMYKALLVPLGRKVRLVHRDQLALPARPVPLGPSLR
jgi:Na+/H+-dicarboxylate symporter